MKYAEITDLRTCTAEEVADSAILQMVLDSPSIIIFSLDRSYRYTSFNKAHADTIRAIWGIEIAIGMNMLEEVVGNEFDRQNAKRNFDRALAGEEVVVIETYGDESLNRRHYEDRYCPARLPDGTIFGVTVLVTDITERIKVAEDKLKLELQLQKAARLESLGLLAGGMAHDYNNLLVPVKLYAEMARDLVAECHPVTQLMDNVIQAVQRASDLTKQLLAFSGGDVLEKRVADLNELIRESTDLVSVSVGRQLTVKYALSTTALYADVDTTQFRQVLMNLLINASEAMKGKPGTITIATSYLNSQQSLNARITSPEQISPGNYVLLTVADTGCGMTDAQLSRIFEPFLSNKGAGRGLGLAAVQGVVLNHGGFLAVNSKVDMGTVFHVGLPVAVQQPEQQSHPLGRSQTAAVESTNSQKRSMRILVADDDADIRRVIELAFNSAGHKVMLADDGLSALKIYQDHAPFDLILLDLTMPEMGGAAFAQELGSENSTPVVFMSGYSEDDLQFESARYGVQRVLRKPFSLRSLLALIQDVPEQIHVRHN